MRILGIKGKEIMTDQRQANWLINQQNDTIQPKIDKMVHRE